MFVTYKILNRIGNICLEIYKTFRYALEHKINFKNVVFEKHYYSPLFENIKENFIDEREYGGIKFDFILHESSDINIVPPSNEQNVMFTGCNWIYPNTIQEMQLFNYIFDSKTLYSMALEKYYDLFSVPTIGYTVRRGDFVHFQNTHKLISLEQLNNDIDEIINRHFGYIRIIMTSDDVNWCKSNIKNKSKIFFLEDTPEMQIITLSFCDYVVQNGSYYRSIDHICGRYESTFGQIP